MQLQFPLHFKEKIVERSIDVDRIKQTIRNPDYQVAETDNRILSRKKIDHRTLEVIYVKGSSKNKFIIVTAYWWKK
ncbi:MAG: hypothetical protein A2832_01715 [Candidatus Zambryskibacteria bacterium RIFCSPHIGHO2_01_FULL_44_22b]|uniref:Uncharacterized protein n=2 Tax=Candidatus Zambryskiibacteriota TaxID=1817925 RepID=A0A1G2SYB7_9BACT|nr:MAG: hypothetical protein A2832_01715 [Candidatus Zambryskibacteria bacterium RIFCSPHIGHO2_01_FULL_44_22b]OHB05574.1 MAG: hypothetical protein A3B16_01850 [Candidatus Zambryskibacteria bacterium RIFCSPLOWO2_01_FULL_45_43]